MTDEEEKKVDLLARLQSAAELEMTTIPAYLTALLSIKRPGNRGVAENIRSVMTEEMLHLALVSNVMSSIGGKLRVTDIHVPSYPFKLTFKGKGFVDRQFDVHLAAFSEEAIKTFMAVERPRAPKSLTSDFGRTGTTVPEYTIGEFYDRIITLLDELHTSLGSKRLFVGNPSIQIGEDYYWSAGGKPVIVSDIATAKSAMQTVIQQGEGTSDPLNDGDSPQIRKPFEVAHYYRFREIFCKKRYASTDIPTDDPTGEPLEVDYTSVYPIKTDAKSTDYEKGSPLSEMNNTFNRQYSQMLIQLEEGLNGNPKILYTAIMNGMHGLSELGIRMMATPIPGDKHGLHGCPTFEWLDAQRPTQITRAL